MESIFVFISRWQGTQFSQLALQKKKARQGGSAGVGVTRLFYSRVAAGVGVGVDAPGDVLGGTLPSAPPPCRGRRREGGGGEGRPPQP